MKLKNITEADYSELMGDEPVPDNDHFQDYTCNLCGKNADTGEICEVCGFDTCRACIQKSLPPEKFRKYFNRRRLDNEKEYYACGCTITNTGHQGFTADEEGNIRDKWGNVRHGIGRKPFHIPHKEQ